MKNKNLIIPFLSAVLVLSGCSFFTTSWGKQSARNLTPIYEQESASALADLIMKRSSINDPEALQELLIALGKKSKEELSNLSNEQKENIMGLLVTNTISIDFVTDVLPVVLGKQEADGPAIIKNFFSSVTETDINATLTLLDDKKTLDSLDPLTTCFATGCLLVQVAKQEGADERMDEIITEVVKYSENPEKMSKDDVAKIILGPDCKKESAQAIDTALEVALHFKQNDTEIFAGMKYSDFFSAFTK